MKQFLVKHYKAIYKILVLFFFLTLFILLTTFKFSMWAAIIVAIAFYYLVPMTLIRLDHILQRVTDNAIFFICPRCGYGSVGLAETCQNCNYRQGSLISSQTISKAFPDKEYRDIEQNKRHGIYNSIPIPIMKNVPLIENEIILISVRKPSMRLFSITRNGDSVIRNKFNSRCLLNWLILTNKRIFFHAEMFGGWRLGFSHSYDDIKSVRTQNKAIYSPLLDEVDRMIIETTDGTYQLRGINPKKLYEAIQTNLRKYGSVD